jgi:hypothetical protein
MIFEKYPIENLFRRPWEYASAYASFAAASCLAIFPDVFMLHLPARIICIIGLLGLANYRWRQARYLSRFQRNLRQLTEYKLESVQIPYRQDRLFIGLGFYWTQKHVQRLFMARHPNHEHLRARNERYLRVRDRELRQPESAMSRWTQSKRWDLKNLSQCFLNVAPSCFDKNVLTAAIGKIGIENPVAPLPPVGGDPAIHGVEPDEREIWMDLLERVGHTLVLGTTRVGKTRLCEIMVTQDIRRGEVVIVFDPKGDVQLCKRCFAEAKRAGRSDQLVFPFRLS